MTEWVNVGWVNFWWVNDQVGKCPGILTPPPPLEIQGIIEIPRTHPHWNQRSPWNSIGNPRTLQKYGTNQVTKVWWDLNWGNLANICHCF